jgi:ferredoxin
MYTTGATKNLFGTVPSVNKAACHAKFPSRESFAKVIIGIHETIRPSFCIMDAVIGMEGAGPANGTPRQFGYLMASDNCLAMDMVQAQMMGYETSDIPILKEAERRHVLPTEIRYPLLNVNDCIIKDFDKVPVRRRTKLIRSLLMPFLTSGVQKRRQRKEPGPEFNAVLCIRCLRCVKICPQKALELQKQEDGTEKVVCDYRKCIRCYCCHEMCPVNAIHVEDRTAK